MSIRNFERSFHSATDMSPKMPCCVTRFNKALELKLQNPKMPWTSVAHQTGYFDQMHIIKEFKKFSGHTPKTLLKDAFLLEEEHTNAPAHN